MAKEVTLCYFRDSLMPQYCVSFDLNITHFYREIKRRGLSFSMAFMYETAKCGNKIENFRYRFENGEVVLYDQIGTSFTYMEKGAELFKMIKVDMKDTLEEYIETAQTIIKNQTAYFDAPPGNDVFVFRQFHGYPSIIFPIHMEETGKAHPRHLTGESSLNAMVKCGSRFLFRCIIPSLTGCI